MIVIVAGMQRSGSTFSFNVVRELLQARGKLHQEPFGLAAQVLERSGDAQHVLIKAHAVDEFTMRLIQVGAARVVCTFRRPVDAIASWQETFGFNLEDSIREIETWLAMFQRIRNQALIISYDELDLHPFRAAWRIAQHLCPDAGVPEVKGIARRYTKKNVKAIADGLQKDAETVERLEFSYFDKATFFHRNHVSTIASRPAEERIPPDAIEAVRQRLGRYLDEEGNLLV
jgi:hypothetical protein